MKKLQLAGVARAMFASRRAWVFGAAMAMAGVANAAPVEIQVWHTLTDANKAEFEKLMHALRPTNCNKIESLCGEEGVALLERVDRFFFSDMEQRVLARHLEELQSGHAIIAVETSPDRVSEAVRVASELGARRLIHFGSLVVTWLTK